MGVIEIGEIIASRSFQSVGRDGQIHELTVELGRPVPFPNSTNYYAPYVIRGEGIRDLRYVGGVDAIQAFQLVMKMIGGHLETLKRNGMKVTWEGDDSGGLGFDGSYSQPTSVGVMITDEQFSRLEGELKTLERIAKQFAAGSTENETIRKAAIALMFGTTEETEKFFEYFNNFDGPLNSEQKEFIRKHGIEGGEK